MEPAHTLLQEDHVKRALDSIPPADKRLLHNKNLPFPFIPASTERFREIYYWDSYFTLIGLRDIARNRTIIRGTVEDMFMLLDNLGHVPNSSHTYTTRSQPPFLSSMVLLVKGAEKRWIQHAYEKLVTEYENVWMSYPRHTDCGLSRYYNDRSEEHIWEAPGVKAMQRKGWDMADYGAIQESGWDMTRRFDKRAHDVCPVDLNSLLYRYEKDLQLLAYRVGKDSYPWHKAAGERVELFNQYFWNEKEGFYFDYDSKREEQLTSRTMAGFFPLWAKIATQEQAERVRENLMHFERDHGMACTEEQLADPNCQWSYPNGWPPLHWIAIQGLRNYGFHKDADRITTKWLNRIAYLALNFNHWPEKNSVVKDTEGHDDPRYAHQKHQAWTMGVFQALCRDLAMHERG